MNEPANIDLGEVMQRASRDVFWHLRAHAIQSYASLEQSLCLLFGALTGLDRDTASIVYFKVGAGSRNKLLELLFKKKYGTQYNLFRNSLLTHLVPIDQVRNKIIHWNTVTQANENGFQALVLKPPTDWAADSEQLGTGELLTFMHKCDFFSRLLNTFVFWVIEKRPDFTEEMRKPYVDIASAAIVYPPPTTHPIYRPPFTLST